ncbi:MAG TPA: lysozyme inhibitor LprI family protein [Geminicoccaceae bacterium]|nr:lysozyme inhibitor LprI family protein [Geminicoccus sp.]HMU51263.1 lysozyme inhibitor LprI family protein [Geminicoccaceae bacterium]
MIAVLLGLLVLALAPLPAAALDCSHASGSERRICQSAMLRGLDARQAEVLGRLRARATPVENERLTAEQRGFLKRRNDCMAAESPDDCLRRAYEDRTLVLQRRLASVTAVETPLERCGKVAGTRLEVGACLERLATIVERDLAAAGRKAGAAAAELEKATGRPGPVAALEASGRAFDAYRDAECGRQRAMMDAGTGAGDVERSCRILLAEQRALELAAR